MTFLNIIQTAPHSIKRKLEQLKFLRERPDYHPEPSAFHHIQIVTDRLIQTGNPDLIMAGVLHDICKFDTVRENPKTGWPTSPFHDEEAYNLIQSNTEIQNWIADFGADPIRVSLLCKFHMKVHQLHEMREKKSAAYIEDWKKLGIWKELQIFGESDNMLREFNLDTIDIK